ncbi:MAG: hypothetical protein R3194_01985, partial [Limnobacter sp.]|nr:hypothetical protein [Limnobacter sp.]
MPRQIKWLLPIAALLGLGAILAHGVVVPQFIWQPTLKNLQAQYPDQQISVNRVVAGLSHRPHLLLAGVSVGSEKYSESMDIGLMRLEVDGWKSLQKGRLVIDTLAIKNLVADRTSSKDCNEQGVRCLPLTPAGLVVATQNRIGSLPGKPSLELRDVELTQWQLQTQTLRGDTSLLVNLDLFTFLAESGKEDTAKLAFRVVQPTEPGIEQAPVNKMSLAFSATPKLLDEPSLSLINLQGDVSGQWHGRPWTGSLASDIVRLNQQSGWTFQGNGLRAYLRRDDQPEIHQAAFSSLDFEGGLPLKPMIFRQSEWTFTAEQAQAWTFDLTLIPSLGLVDIQPAVIEGSEGEPAQAQSRILNCSTEKLPLFGLFGDPASIEP